MAWSLVLLSPPAKQHGAVFLPPQPVPTQTPGKIFLVENRSGGDLYSNGLQIRNSFATQSNPRSYRPLDRSTLRILDRSTLPSGIVFHTTESLVTPLDANQVDTLNRRREDLLSHVRKDRLYNFVIDRVGEVFRVVPENQTALHAGHSIWADASYIYINLNESFVGVAFEMKAGETATPAQRNSGKLLTELLRGQYQIPDGNCVTHAQVSVNPDNLRIGFHTDWGSGFPFQEVGLSVGYRARIAAVELFGFGYDDHFLEAVGGHPWVGLLAAEQQILIDAAAHGTLSSRYRTTIQQHYTNLRRQKHETSE
jgi:hypothetical protein